MSIGFWQLVIVFIIIFIIFGAGKIPRLMGDLAKGINIFRKEVNSEDNIKKGTKAQKDMNVPNHDLDRE